ncbi:hypothetical protein [Comamonas sp.]|uniref:hypothetical protein n=1 Tax=Comamonas sp. TaxID=34028 RepID=UPI002897D4A7|nr:hypothetical protein [Comamonas sp.]
MKTKQIAAAAASLALLGGCTPYAYQGRMSQDEQLKIYQDVETSRREAARNFEKYVTICLAEFPNATDVKNDGNQHLSEQWAVNVAMVSDGDPLVCSVSRDSLTVERVHSGSRTMALSEYRAYLNGELAPSAYQSKDVSLGTSDKYLLAPRPNLQLSRLVWDELAAPERQLLEANYSIDYFAAAEFGTIIDVQGVDESTPGTHAGAAIGSAVASAAYIDRAIRGGHNYSVGVNLAVGILGAVLGSLADKPAVTQFQFRYTIKKGDGELDYVHQVQETAFRSSPGACVLLPTLQAATQQLCDQTTDSLRKRHLAKLQAAAAATTAAAPPAPQAD